MIIGASGAGERAMIETTQAEQTSGIMPRVYRPSWGWRAFLLAISLLLGGSAAVGIWYFGTGHGVRGILGTAILVCLCIAFLLLSAYLAAWTSVASVTVWPSRIESRDLFRTHMLSRQDILGRRILQQRNGPPYLVLVPRNSSLKQMRIAQLYDFDATFQDWKASLPDLDEEEVHAGEQEILNNEEIGATPDDRMEALSRGKRLCRFLNVATVAVGAWAAFYPRPYHLVVFLLVLLPWVALAITARSGGLFRIDSKKNDPHPNVALPFIMPGLLLMLRVTTDMKLLDWRGPLYLSVALACILGTAAVIADRSLGKRRSTAVLLFVLSISYGYGASMEANALLDHSVTSIYHARVTGKHISSGRHTSYNLYLAPWGPKQDRDVVSVSRLFYDSVRPGDDVCLALHDGFMHMPWSTVHPCAKAVQAPSW
jgi:hypothetical protein